MRVYSDNAQMTSKRGVNKEVRYEPQASSVTDVLSPRFDVFCALSEFYTLFGYGSVRNIGNVFENLHVDDLRVE